MRITEPQIRDFVSRGSSSASQEKRGSGLAQCGVVSVLSLFVHAPICYPGCLHSASHCGSSIHISPWLLRQPPPSFSRPARFLPEADAAVEWDRLAEAHELHDVTKAFLQKHVARIELFSKVNDQELNSLPQQMDLQKDLE